VAKDHLVAGDVMLAQKIALETDERGALATANNLRLDNLTSQSTGRRAFARPPRRSRGRPDSSGNVKMPTLLHLGRLYERGSNRHAHPLDPPG